MKRRLESFYHAARGIVDFIRFGTNAKIQTLAGILVISSGFYLEFSPYEWIAVTICIGAVLSAEALNTAIEVLADEVSKERKESIRKVKDMAAGAVLIACMASVVVGALILGGRV